MGCALAASAAAQSTLGCTIAVTPVAFGTYDVFATTPTDSTGRITYRCSRGNLAITIALGTGSSGSFTLRRMRQGTETLSYNLYLDATRTVIWGDGTGGSSVYTDPRTTAATTEVTIFARIPAGQDVGAGVYADTITATVHF